MVVYNVIPTFQRLRHGNHSEFEVSLVYILSPGQPALSDKTLSQKRKKIIKIRITGNTRIVTYFKVVKI